MAKVRCAMGAIGVVIGLLIIWSSPAMAQDGPTLTVEPGSVDGPGDYEFTVSGSGWTKPVVGVFPCESPESGNLEDVMPTTCLIGLAEEVEPVDGSFEFTKTYPVDETGLAIVASNPPPDENTEAAGVIITVSAAEAAGEAEPELANTGSETGPIAVAGIAVVLAGSIFALSARRLTRA